MARQTIALAKLEWNFKNLSKHNRNKIFSSRQRISYQNKVVNKLHALLKVSVNHIIAKQTE